MIYVDLVHRCFATEFDGKGAALQLTLKGGCDIIQMDAV